MTSAQRREVERMLEEGKPVTQGVLPDLDPEAARYASLWSELRASTHGEHPISIPSIACLVGRGELREVLPIIQGMDSAYFAFHGRRQEAERKRRETKAKASRNRAPRGRRGR